MIQKIIPIAASITLIGSSSLTAYADDMLDKDYIVREIWSDWWNGNVIDSFMPFSTLTEDTAEENRNSVITDDENGTAHRVGENLKIEANATVGVSEEATKPTSAEKSSNGLIYGIGGIVLAGIAVLAGFLIKSKRC